MKKIWILLSALLFSVTSVADCDFQIKKENIKDYNYLIIPGFLNEFIAFYMTEYRRYLLKQGVPEDQIIRVRLSSFQSPEEGAQRIDKAVKKGVIHKNNAARQKSKLAKLYTNN